MDSETVKAWIGQEICLEERLAPGVTVQREFRVLEFLGAGAHNVAFRVRGQDGDSVVKFRKTHIAFTIHLLPDQFFPKVRSQQGYEEKLIAQLVALHGSALLSTMAPLDELWTALAVQHLADRDQGEQEVHLEHYDTLADCDFVRQQLEDWATADVGRSEDELLDLIVVHQGEKPIHAAFPQFLARAAQSALKDLPHARGQDSSFPLLRSNPLLPWIAAATTGYTIPVTAARLVGESLGRCTGLERVVKQTAQVCRYAIRPRTITLERMLEFLEFLLSVIRASGSEGDDLCRVFLEEKTKKV